MIHGKEENTVSITYSLTPIHAESSLGPEGVRGRSKRQDTQLVLLVNANETACRSVLVDVDVHVMKPRRRMVACMMHDACFRLHTQQFMHATLKSGSMTQDGPPGTSLRTGRVVAISRRVSSTGPVLCPLHSPRRCQYHIQANRALNPR